MNLQQITRNAENQVAASLKAKVERFMKSKKSESRLALLLDIRNLAQDLQEITCRKTDYDMLSKPEAVSPLPPKTRNLADFTGKPLGEEWLLKHLQTWLNHKITKGCDIEIYVILILNWLKEQPNEQEWLDRGWPAIWDEVMKNKQPEGIANSRFTD